MLRFILLISCFAVSLALASPAFADTVSPAVAAQLGLPSSYQWHYDPTEPGLRHYYTLTHTYATWDNALTEALGAGGDLAVIDNNGKEGWTNEDNFLATEFASQAYTQDQAAVAPGSKDPFKNIAWIGLSKPADGNGTSWEWRNLAPLDTAASPLYYRWADTTTPAPAPYGPQAGNHAYLHMANHPGETDGTNTYHAGAGMWNANNPHDTTTSLFPLGIIESKIQGDIPEPTTLAVLLAGGLALLRRRRI